MNTEEYVIPIYLGLDDTDNFLLQVDNLIGKQIKCVFDDV